MDTLKSRTIEINLSDAEVTYISELAAKYDTTVGEMIENFICDLTDSERSNGSDERMHAEEWLDRRFGVMENGSFLQYLLENDELDAVISACREIEDSKSTITELENELASGVIRRSNGRTITWKDIVDKDENAVYSSKEEWEKEEKATIQDTTEFMEDRENIIKDRWNDYKHESNCAESPEAEMRKIMEYLERYEYLLGE